MAPGSREDPTYLVVGTKRGGTSSIDSYLKQHPDVRATLAYKGSRYFDVNWHRGEAWFTRTLPLAAGFDRAERRGDRRPICGEASPYYMYHAQAPGRMAERLPQARLIVLLREPVSRSWSHYRYEQERGYESLGWDQALAAEDVRLAQAGEMGERSRRHHTYVDRSRYSNQLERLARQFEPQQILVVESERLFQEPRETMHTIHAFLGLDAYDLATYEIVKGQRPASLPQGFENHVMTSVSEDLTRLRGILAAKVHSSSHIPRWLDDLGF